MVKMGIIATHLPLVLSNIGILNKRGLTKLNLCQSSFVLSVNRLFEDVGSSLLHQIRVECIGLQSGLDILVSQPFHDRLWVCAVVFYAQGHDLLKRDLHIRPDLGNRAVRQTLISLGENVRQVLFILLCCYLTFS